MTIKYAHLPPNTVTAHYTDDSGVVLPGRHLAETRRAEEQELTTICMGVGTCEVDAKRDLEGEVEVTRPLILDTFCGAGGCSVGYHAAGFDVVGIDNRPQKRYPYSFVQGDALEELDALIRGGFIVATDGRAYSLEDFSAVHASPPCQAYTQLRGTTTGKEYPELIEPTRALLKSTHLPYVMENVMGAPLESPSMICGATFGLGASGMDLPRHRLFETSFLLMVHRCGHRGRANPWSLRQRYK